MTKQTRMTEDRVAVAAAYWLDASPHERTEEDGLILAQYARQAMNEIRRLREENEKLKRFYNYFADLYGQNLEVLNWHQNGATEPFDSFFDSAECEMEGEE